MLVSLLLTHGPSGVGYLRPMGRGSRQRVAGQRLRQAARRRRRGVLVEYRRPLAQFAAVFVLVSSVLIFVFTRLWGEFGAGLAAGGATASGFMFWFVFVDLLDPVGSRTGAGLTGEELTASELKRARRAGWRAVHNLHFHQGDVDHVAIGPGGVVAIETKTSSCDWRFIERHGTHVTWARQAHQGSERVRHLIKQHCGVDVTVAAIVVPWIRDQPDEPSLLVEGVVRVRGRSIAQYLESLPPVLDADLVSRIGDALDAVGADFDRAAGVVHDSFVGRVLRLGR